MSDDKPQKMNLDLIQMVQNARMAHDDDALPSQVPGVYWIETKAPPENAQSPTPRAGEWRIATTIEHIDDLWLKVKAATQAGKLGYKSKASTRPAHNQGTRDERLICVRTYDADDSDDVQRVKAALDELEIDAPMHYVRDDD